MTDNDIVLGLKCLADEDEILCKDCAFRDMDRGFACKKNVSKAAIDLINRQKADIERITLEYAGFQAGVNRFADIGKMYSEIRAEAIKEFAERLKEIDDYVSPLDIDNLVKEMTEE